MVSLLSDGDIAELLHLRKEARMGATGACVFKRCGCREKESGRQLGGRCPRLPRHGHGSWYLAAELPAGPDGRRRRVRLGGYPTRPDAEAMLARLQAPSGPRRATAVSCTTGRWLASWLAARQTLGPSARRSYQQHLNDYLIPGIGSIPLALLTPADVRAMFAAISRRRTQAGTLLSAATMVRIRCTLRAALNAAIREGLIAANPARLVELPAPARPHPVVWTVPRVAAWRESGIRPAVAVWTAVQTAAFLAAIRDEPLYACYQMLAVSGLRRGEAAGLRWPDFDLDGATVTVTRQLQEIGGSLIVLPPKSVASNRVIALDPWTVQELRGHRDRLRPPGPAGTSSPGPAGGPTPPAT
jgi:integrase